MVYAVTAYENHLITAHCADVAQCFTKRCFYNLFSNPFRVSGLSIPVPPMIAILRICFASLIVKCDNENCLLKYVITHNIYADSPHFFYYIIP